MPIKTTLTDRDARWLHMKIAALAKMRNLKPAEEERVFAIARRLERLAEFYKTNYESVYVNGIETGSKANP